MEEDAEVWFDTATDDAELWIDVGNSMTEEEAELALVTSPELWFNTGIGALVASPELWFSADSTVYPRLLFHTGNMVYPRF